MVRTLSLIILPFFNFRKKVVMMVGVGVGVRGEARHINKSALNVCCHMI